MEFKLQLLNRTVYGAKKICIILYYIYWPCIELSHGMRFCPVEIGILKTNFEPIGTYITKSALKNNNGIK